MGISWEDKGKYAHVLVVVPDGRILCQRGRVISSFDKKWQASVYRRLSARFLGALSESAIDSAQYVLNSFFKLQPDHAMFTHLVSHYVEEMDKRLEIVICKVPSGMTIHIPYYLESRFIEFEELTKEIGKNRDAFAGQTVHAINVMTSMSSWMEGE